MYRRHLRMVVMSDIESNNNSLRSEFLQRVVSLPVVCLAWNIAAGTYRSIKTSNKLFKISLTTTEKAAFFVSKPVLKRFAKQLQAADHLACKGLDSLQVIIPSFTNQQRKLYKQTRDIYEDTVESGLKKYEVIKHMGTTKVLQLINESSQKFEEFLESPYGEVCEIALDFAFDAGELYVDHYLPPLGDERPEKLFGDRGKAPSWERAELLRNRFKERLYKHSLLKIQTFKIQTKMFIAKIYHFNMYEYLVEISSTRPTAVAIFIQVFSSFEEVVNYLASFFPSHQRNNSIV